MRILLKEHLLRLILFQLFSVVLMVSFSRLKTRYSVKTTLQYNTLSSRHFFNQKVQPRLIAPRPFWSKDKQNGVSSKGAFYFSTVSYFWVSELFLSVNIF